MRTANAIAWTGQMSVVHLCLKLLYVLYCYCEASLSLGKALYKLNIIIIINQLSDQWSLYVAFYKDGRLFTSLYFLYRQKQLMSETEDKLY